MEKDNNGPDEEIIKKTLTIFFKNEYGKPYLPKEYHSIMRYLQEEPNHQEIMN